MSSNDSSSHALLIRNCVFAIFAGVILFVVVGDHIERKEALKSDFWTTSEIQSAAICAMNGNRRILEIDGIYVTYERPADGDRFTTAIKVKSSGFISWKGVLPKSYETRWHHGEVSYSFSDGGRTLTIHDSYFNTTHTYKKDS